MKKSLTIILSLLLVTLILPVYAETFVGSINSNIYHYSSCTSAKRIKPENLVTFSSAQDAVDRGYRPCEICKPPLPTSSRTDTDTNTNPNNDTSPAVPEFSTIILLATLVAGSSIAIITKKQKGKKYNF